uniref:Uncharacterized protein n=1 Tax=Noctiluca scintillans TaxID=2966 RepID=A0A7S1A216_NOCSC
MSDDDDDDVPRRPLSLDVVHSLLVFHCVALPAEALWSHTRENPILPLTRFWISFELCTCVAIVVGIFSERCRQLGILLACGKVGNSVSWELWLMRHGISTFQLGVGRAAWMLCFFVTPQLAAFLTLPSCSRRPVRGSVFSLAVAFVAGFLLTIFVTPILVRAPAPPPAPREL